MLPRLVTLERGWVRGFPSHWKNKYHSKRPHSGSENRKLQSTHDCFATSFAKEDLNKLQLRYTCMDCAAGIMAHTAGLECKVAQTEESWSGSQWGDRVCSNVRATVTIDWLLGLVAEQGTNLSV